MGDTTEKAEKARGKKVEGRTEQTSVAPESETETPVVTVDRETAIPVATVDREQEGPVLAMSRRRVLWVRELNRRAKVLAREIERKEGVPVFNPDEAQKKIGIRFKRDWRSGRTLLSFTKGRHHYALETRRRGGKGRRGNPYGPFWRMTWRSNGKRVTRHIGKTLFMLDSYNGYSLDLALSKSLCGTTRKQHALQTHTTPSHVF